jgi:rhamnogalacturonan endolyase
MSSHRGHGFRQRLCLSYIVSFLSAVVASGYAQNVTLTDNGSTVTLSNGIVSATIQKTDGKVTVLTRSGGSNLLQNGGSIYFDANLTVGTNSLYLGLSPATYAVVTNTLQLVEISLSNTNMGGFNVELHYAMRSGESGLYPYTIWRHGPGLPDVSFEQSRMVIRSDPNIFTNAFTSPAKIGQMIAPSLLQTNVSPIIMDATYEIPLTSSYKEPTGTNYNGHPVYTKYDWANYVENHTVHGVSSDNTGLWMVTPSWEYLNGGPTRAELKVHGTDTTPVMLWDFQAVHFGASKVVLAADQVWEKIFGPYLIYVNSGTNSTQLWQDAQQKAAGEQAAWPYGWVNQSNYPLQRGTVTGTLQIAGQSTSNALVVLGDQSGTYWQLQSEGYYFWARADANGNFAIPKVRPGTYMLYSHVPGVVGELQVSNVVVTANATNNLGGINWAPPRRERLLWRLGTPDLTAAEFRFGSLMRQFGLWWRYMEERGTNDLVYTIGSSTTTNWYYAQSVVAMDDGTYFCPNWMIQFVLTNLPPAPAVLTVDMAGALSGTFLTSVNGTSLANLSLTNDAGIYRSATRAALFRHNVFTFDPSLLQVGTNILSFSISKPSPWTNSSPTKPVYPPRGVMYDCVQLEAGASVNASNLVWRGDGVANAWDTVSSNWFDGVAIMPFVNGNEVLFDDTGSATAPVDLSGALFPGSVTANSSQDYAFAGNGSLGGTMTLVKSGSGQLTLTTSNTFSGGVTANAGSLTLANAGAAGSGLITLAGGTLNNNATIANAVNVIAPSTLNAGHSQIGGSISGNSSLFVNISGSNNTFTTTGSMSGFSGTIALGNSEGFFRFYGNLGSAAATFDLGTNTVAMLNRNGNVTIQLGALRGGPNTVLKGANSIGTNTSRYVVGGNNLDTVFAGTILDGARLGATTTVVKVGLGTLELAGANGYTGGTTISNGTLLVNNAGGTGTGTGAVIVAGGGTLGGSGTIAGAVTISGTLSPGASVGTLTIGNNLGFNGGAVLAYELGTVSDLTSVSGNLILGGTLNVVDSGGFGSGSYTLFTYGGTLTYNGVTVGTVPAGYNCSVSTSTPGQVKLVVLTPFQTWQMQYFSCTDCPQAAATTDPDGDGMSNTNEFLAGTNPTNSASALRIVDVTQESDDVRIIWTTAGGRTNAAQVTTGDVDGGYSTNFVDLSGLIIIPGSGDATTNYVDVGGATNVPALYYRIHLAP